MVGDWFERWILDRRDGDPPTDGQGRSNAPQYLHAAYPLQGVLSGKEWPLLAMLTNARQVEVGEFAQHPVHGMTFRARGKKGQVGIMQRNEHRGKPRGLADLLLPYALIDDGILLQQDGSD